MEDQIFGFPRYPKFKLGEPRFPQDTFLGRYLHFLDVIDPRTLFTSDAKLKECCSLLDAYGAGDVNDLQVTDEQLWRAQKVKQAIINPDNGEWMWPPFRMSGFVPFGWVTVVGLLLPNPSVASMTCWQWLNQTHNAAVNYSNRNASEYTPASVYVQGYVGAVASSVSIAVGLHLLVKKAKKFNPLTRMIVQRFIPLPAVVCASCFNCYLMRRSELFRGVKVFDKNQQPIGASKVAAGRALRDTIITRAALSSALLAIPPMIMLGMERTAFLKRNPRLHLPVNVISVVATFSAVLPAVIAIFPQVSQIKREDLEPELAAIARSPVLHYNKGL